MVRHIRPAAPVTRGMNRILAADLCNAAAARGREARIAPHLDVPVLRRDIEALRDKGRRTAAIRYRARTPTSPVVIRIGTFCRRR
jgi:hypothetical protein